MFRVLSSRILTNNLEVKFVNHQRCKVKNLVHSIFCEVHTEPSISDEKMQRLKSPRKSPKDEKEYSVIQLQNGLTGLIVSDVKNLVSLDDVRKISESEDQNSVCSSAGSDAEDSDADSVSGEKPNERFAAVALTIGVGSFSDPPEIPGLAHFLEHMIFMGSEKYQEENFFDAYLNTKGGYSNASTDCEETTFYFECHETYLEKAIDIFSQYFISPLLKQEAMTREREAVDSEFQISLSKDHARLQQFFGTLAAPDNPCGKFMWGNKQTLKDNVSDDHLHAATVEFWKRHYSAHRMKLVIQARLPSSLLESWITKYFSVVPSNDLLPDSFPLAGSPFIREKFHKMHTIQSIKDETLVQIGWILPSTLNYYKEKPLEYLAWIIGHEGTSSLMSFFRSKHWALDLWAGVESDQFNNNSLFTYFEITVKLSETGVAAIDEVLAAAFSFVNLVRKQGPNERIYNEIKSLADINFRFQEEEDVTSFVESLSQEMLEYPPEDYICGSDLFEKYDPELIKFFTEQMTPDNAAIIIHSKALSDAKVLDEEEFWYKTKYRSDEIKPELLEFFKNYKLPSFVTLPSSNSFIPSNFDLLPPSGNMGHFPLKIDSNSDRFEIWFKQDSKFKMPTAVMCFHFISDLSGSSAKNSATFDVFLSMFIQILTPYVYPATMCSTSHRIYKTERGFALELEGYHHKLHLVLELILERMKNFPKDASSELFENIKKDAGKQYRNKLKSAKSVERSLRFSALWRNSFFDIDKSVHISNISFNDVIKFSEQLLRKLKAQCLFQGNLTIAQAKEVCDTVQSILQFDALPRDRIPSITVCELPLGKSICKVRSFDTSDANCLTAEYYQSGVFNLKFSCIIQFFEMIFEERLFDTLRTKEQLGYEVSCNYRDALGVLGLSITLVSAIDKFEPQFVEQKLSSFVQHFDEELRSLSEVAFREAQESLIKDKMRAFNCLKDEAKFHFDEIKSQDFFFRRHHEEVKHIKELKLSDLLEWYEKYVKTDAEMLRKLVVQVVGYKPNTDSKSSPVGSKSTLLKYTYIEEPKSSTDSKIIKDIKEFNRSLKCFNKTDSVSSSR